jgi:uncharacterized protein (DUF2147 family)
MKISSLIISTLVASVGLVSLCLQPASADGGPVGEWKVQDGTANIEIKPCGGNLCGHVSWSKEDASYVGREVLINMKPNGGNWSGTVVNVANGQKYAAKISLQGEKLKVEGCVMGGIICGSQNWSRVR